LRDSWLGEDAEDSVSLLSMQTKPRQSRVLAPMAAGFLFLILSLSFCAREKGKQAIRASGTIEAVRVSVGSKWSGEVQEVFVEEGQRVEPGQRLAVLDSSSLEIQLRQAEAGVKLARAQLALLLKGSRSEDLRQAEATLDQAKANLRSAEEDWKRWLNLSEKEGATAKQRDDAQTRLTVARAQVEAAEQALLKLKHGAREEEIEAARARLEQALATRDLLQKTIAEATLTAPISGIVSQKNIEPGEFAMAGAPLFVLSNLDTVEVWIWLTATEVAKVQVGQRAEVTVDSHPGRFFEGKLVFISPEAEFTPKNIQTREERAKLVFRVKLEVSNPEHILKPGLPADAILEVTSAASN